MVNGKREREKKLLKTTTACGRLMMIIVQGKKTNKVMRDKERNMKMKFQFNSIQCIRLNDDDDPISLAELNVNHLFC